ncbi:MAG TPA: hypothetical protein VNA28_10385 [Solirubrobacteraceae bacterium]|nr:hypothetical protein [Solirubrobacteraceae bacterium]
MSPSIRSIVLALVLGALLAPAAAQASPTQQSIMMDDDLLVYRDDSTAARTLTQMKSLGVDTVRVTVLWKTVAEFAKFTKTDLANLKASKKGKSAKAVQRAIDAARRQNKRFKAANPGTYPIRNWDRYDNLVRAATDRGIRVYFNITGPGPKWAHAKKPKGSTALQSTFKPNAREFKLFVTAVGKRFAGNYRDENGSRGTLPRVNMWSLWNEPNQGGWLSPQWETRGGQVVPASPAIFRKLHQAGYQGLVAAGHRTDNSIILLGETAPLGNDAKTGKSPMRPKQFLREVFCIQPDGNPYTGAAASARKCGDLARGPLQASGYAHHPYTKNLPPTQRDPHPDAVTMANIAELGSLLDEMSAKTNAVAPGLSLFMTEYGFETNPPDPFSGVLPALQAKYNTVGEFLAWSNPRIASQAQFLLRDVAPVAKRARGSKGYWFTYQSGLLFERGQPKPAAYAYSFPFVATLIGVDEATTFPVFALWGQARFRPNGAADTVQLQWKPKDNSLPFAPVGDPVPVDFFGYFNTTAIAPAPVAGDWRAVFLLPDGVTIGSASLSADGS